MSFGFGNSPGAGAGASVQSGPDIEEIQATMVGFLALCSDERIRLLPTPWPKDALPPPTSSLLSIASKRGLVAAAGPDALIVASTESIRQAFTARVKADESNLKPFTPQLTTQVPRVNQVSFTADESFLVICAESGGGLAVYDVQALMQGSKEPAFQLGTQGVSVRALIPNPAEAAGEYVSVLLTDGKLMLADLKNKQFINGPNGPVLQENVSCISWSVKGKQLVAGLGNGAAVQLKPNGQLVTEIPKPPGLTGDEHVSTIYWLANDEFLVIHSPTSFKNDRPPDHSYHFILRQKNTSNFQYRKVASDPSAPFGMNRSPPHHFIVRLRDWEPNLKDMLIVSSTTSGEIGVFTNSISPLMSNTSNYAIENITNMYTITKFDPEDRGAALPYSNEESMDTSPIGLALDLSSKDIVRNPLPQKTDVIEESSSPLPCLMALNNEGVLCAWWVVYDEALFKQVPYRGLAAAGAQTPAAAQPASSASPFAASAASTFGQSGFAAARSSPWSSLPAQAGAPSFGKPAFGAPTFGSPAAPSFGTPGGFAQRSSVWGTPGQQGAAGKPPANPFGASTSSASPFAALGTSGTSAAPSPFSSLAAGAPGASGFAALGQQAKSSAPAFASAGGVSSTPGTSFSLVTEPSFGSTVTLDSTTTGAKSPWSKTSFTAPQTQESDMGDADDQAGENRDRSEATPTPQVKPQGLFGLGEKPFTLGTTFKKEEEGEDVPDPKADSGPSMFSSGFTSALSATKPESTPKTPVKEPEIEEPKIKDITFTPPSPAPAPKAKESPPPSEQPAEIPPAPLPPSPKLSTAKDQAPAEEEDLPPIAGSPAIPIEAPGSSPISSPPSERSGEVTEPEVDSNRLKPPAPEPPKASASGGLFGQAPAWGWQNTPQPSRTQKSRSTSRSPSRSPARASPVSHTPAGFPKGYPTFPPPAIHESPRSPSPVRSISQPAPGFTRKVVPAAQPVTRRSPPQAQLPPPEPDVSDLSDEDDERTRELLESEVIGKRDLEPFIAHQDYAGKVSKQGIPGQIERVYRDINGMIDTLGLNARALAAFVKGHMELFKDEGRSREDLDIDFENQDDDWCLVEIEDLQIVEHELETSLDQGRVTDVNRKLTDLHSLKKDVTRLRLRISEIRRQLEAHKDPEKAARLRAAPLSAEQSQQQHSLRGLFADLQTNLARAEEGIVTLRTNLATHARGAARESVARPTVEAVFNTIQKMTAMIERKSADVDVLETTVRKLARRMDEFDDDSDEEEYENGMRRSRLRSSLRSSTRSVDRDPFTTPPTNKGKQPSLPGSQMGSSSTGKTYGLFFTPDQSPAGSLVVGLSGLAIGDAARGETVATREEIRAFWKAEAGRQGVLARLRDGVLKKGIRVTEPGTGNE